MGLNVSSNNSEDFFYKFNDYMNDGRLSIKEYDDLKKTYIQENNTTESDFNQKIAPTIDIFKTNSEIPDLSNSPISKALDDGLLNYQEYLDIKSYYMKTFGISSEIFNLALDYVLRNDLIKYLRDNPDKEIDLSNFKPKKATFSDVIEDSIAKSIAKELANAIVKMRTQDDFSEYTYRVLKNESDKTFICSDEDIKENQ
ncbi:MAG: hypothetical protein U0354_19880 [Candidatus Sericytochromatia bacterium]